MLRRFRPFRYNWSLLFLLGALVAASAACDNNPNSESDSADYCQQHPSNC